MLIHGYFSINYRIVGTLLKIKFRFFNKKLKSTITTRKLLRFC
ncbi:hypothetical protein V7147_08580 [Bacillus sp. JJ1521]